MGKNSKMKPNFIHAVITVIVLVVHCFSAAAQQEEGKTMQTQRLVLKNIQEFIEVLRQGKDPDSVIDLNRSLPSLMIGNKPDPKAMKALGEELATGNQDVRQNIIMLLSKLRYLNSPSYELRTPEIIALLVGPAFAKPDGAKDDAMDLLREYVSTTTLSRYGDVFTKALKEEPTETGLLLIAKVKPPKAKEEVERLSQLPEWNDPYTSGPIAMKIALAALGDTKIEDEFIADAARAEEAGDAEELEKALHLLAQIGTRRSLQAVGQRMRSPLIKDRVGIRKTSVRLDVMDALRYAFPERPELNSSEVNTDEDYIKVEKFCVQKLGVRFDGVPRPDFFTMEPYPINYHDF